MAAARSLHIACSTWAQVEAIYERKLRRGNLMSIKVPFAAAPGDAITLGLELPSQVVVAIDGAITRTAPIDGSDKQWIEVELLGLTGEVVARLRRMVEDARTEAPSPPPPSAPATTEAAAADMPSDERRLFLALSAELRRLRGLPAHAVLGVDERAGGGSVRRGWLALVRQFHPDLVAARRSPAISHLAEELVLHVNRAYERCRTRPRRDAAVPIERTPAGSGPLLRWTPTDHGAAQADAAAARANAVAAERRQPVAAAAAAPPVAAADDEPDVVITRTRTEPQPTSAMLLAPEIVRLLADGAATEARELLATALTAHPRSRALRGLYHLTSGVIAVLAGQAMLAVSQLELAAGHDDEHGHAAALLRLLRDGTPDAEAVRQVFRGGARVTVAVGIDLGTSNSAVAIIEPSGRARIFTTPGGATTMPSLVWFADGGPRVGEAALPGLDQDPSQTVAGVKRLLGRSITHPVVQQLAATLPYGVVASPRGEAWIALGDGRRVAPEYVAALILRELRAMAERALGAAVTEAVITVPAWYDSAQRRAVVDAAEIAGLTARRLLSEPTAAGLGYGAHRGQGGRHLICDLGGGTFDVSVVDVDDGVFEVLATAGDAFLGGDDIDLACVTHLLGDVRTQLGVDISSDASRLDRLRLAARRAKHALSTALEAAIDEPGLGQLPSGRPLDYRTTLRRLDLERWAVPLLQRLVPPCHDALARAGCEASDVDEILLVGGMTRMPAVRARLREALGRTPREVDNPDEIVAVGAALAVARLAGAIEGILLIDVCARGFAISVDGGPCEPVIAAGAAVPTREHRVLATQRAGQRAVEFDLWEGESLEPQLNRHLARYVVTDLPEAPAGDVLLAIDVTVDVDGVVRVGATELVSGDRPPVGTVLASGLPRGELDRLRSQLGGEADSSA